MYKHSPVTIDLPKMLMRVKLDNGNMGTFYDDSLPSFSPELIIPEQLEQIEDTVCGALLWVQPVP